MALKVRNGCGSRFTSSTRFPKSFKGDFKCNVSSNKVNISKSFHSERSKSTSVVRQVNKSPAVLRMQLRSSSTTTNPYVPLDTFVRRHIGPRDHQIKEMLGTLGYDSLDALTKDNVPKSIQTKRSLSIGPERGESDMLNEMKELGKLNRVYRSFIGMGYYGTILPAVIQRNVVENPGWYTPYTPYQAEISQGRLESLLNYQTMISDMTKMDISNASLLDEGTAAAEAMSLCFNAKKKKKNTFIVSEDCHPQTIQVVKTRGALLGIQVEVADVQKADLSNVCGVLIQYPATDGRVIDYEPFVNKAHESDALVVCATDLLALAVIRPPGEFGVDVALGNAQRFGVPMGYGGPHAAFFAVRDEYKRVMPGRLIGVSKDKHGDYALRMSLQTREQHIRRETATSNICTAQALLANVSAMYAVYHGPQGIKEIAERVNRNARVLAAGLTEVGCAPVHDSFFDTVRVDFSSNKAAEVCAACVKRGINIRKLSDSSVTISLDETTTETDINLLIEAFAEVMQSKALVDIRALAQSVKPNISLNRSSPFLTHPNFNNHHSETSMMRYLKRLENRDISLTNSMIALGSCTMKLNAATEMYPITWPGNISFICELECSHKVTEFAALHPFVPRDQAQGYTEMFNRFTRDLSDITGFHTVSLQPNAGSQGEYTGLRVILAYLQSIGQGHRKVCIIPESAHGTNPASAAMCGMKIVVVKTDKNGNVDLNDLKEKCQQNSQNLACLMITYPSTYGVFEDGIKEICEIIHSHGGQVYMDGANMNAQAGLTSPGEIGADVCHLNLHKTFCIPHGGGGPGMGPIGVAKHLAPFLPRHPIVDMGKFGGEPGKAIGAVAAAPFSSASILPISYSYIRLMGSLGIVKATQMAILNANYMAKMLKGHYNIVYSKPNGLVAHEFILDCRPFKKIGVEVEDIAKRLMDYGFHAPTMAFPIHDTLMVEPTESEPKESLDQLIDALVRIRKEIQHIEDGKLPKDNNPLKNAPHTQKEVVSDKWDRPYSREEAAFPAPWLRDTKYWPVIGRVDGVFGDRNLICSCPPIESYQ